MPWAHTSVDPAPWSPGHWQSRYTPRLDRWPACPTPRSIAASRLPHARPAADNHSQRPSGPQQRPPGPSRLLASAGATAAHRSTALHCSRTVSPVPPWGRRRRPPRPLAQSISAAMAPAIPAERCAPLRVVPAAETAGYREHDRRATPPPSAQYLASPSPSWASSRSVWSSCPPCTYNAWTRLHHIANPRCSTRHKALEQMHLKLTQVVSEITGVTGMAIL